METTRQVKYEIVCFDNSDGNFTGKPHTMAAFLPRAIARRMLDSYRAINPLSGKPEHQFRYIMRKQRYQG